MIELLVPMLVVAVVVAGVVVLGMRRWHRRVNRESFEVLFAIARDQPEGLRACDFDLAFNPHRRTDRRTWLRVGADTVDSPQAR